MQSIALFCSEIDNDLNKPLYEHYSALPWIKPADTKPEESFLVIDGGRLGLADKSWPKVHAVYVDFTSAAAEHRRLHGGGAGQAVAKAVGINKKKDLKILDATAGLGRDAFVLASLGADVTLMERNPVVRILLNDGLDRLRESGLLPEIAQRMTFIEGSILDSNMLEKTGHYDVVYLDPMFPERSKSAMVKKDMALFHELIGTDLDADDLLEPALTTAEYRVVVKRSKKAPLLMNRKPSTALVGKSSRFDIYAKKALDKD